MPIRFVFCLAPLLLAASAAAQTVEVETVRHGATYARFETASLSACAQACAGDGRCMAWTVVMPGLQGPRAICELKASAAPPAASPCCVSGLKGAGVAPRVAPAAAPDPGPAADVRPAPEAAPAPKVAQPVSDAAPPRRAASLQRPVARPPARQIARPDPASALAGGPG